MLRQLAEAADLRAAGKSWEAVAAALRRVVATCRGWPNRYRPTWDRLYQAAERDHMTEARAEATALLRQQLRSEDTKEVRDAAKALLAAAGRDRKTPAESPDDPLEQFTDGLSDDQVQDLQDEFGP
jgi:predicted metal-dependent phosphoesterase TrpH